MLNLVATDRIVFLLYKKSTTFWDNPRSIITALHFKVSHHLFNTFYISTANNHTFSMSLEFALYHKFPSFQTVQEK